MTNTEYQQIVKNWENFIYKTAFKFAKINKLSNEQQQDLIQEGYIAVYDAYQSYLTNGKEGNDPNGLIKLYIEGRIKTFCTRKIPVIRKGELSNEDYSYNIPIEENDIDWDDNDWIANKMLEENKDVTEFKLIKKYYGLDGEEKMNYEELAEWYTKTYHHYVTAETIKYEIILFKQKIKRDIRKKTHNNYRKMKYFKK